MPRSVAATPEKLDLANHTGKLEVAMKNRWIAWAAWAVLSACGSGDSAETERTQLVAETQELALGLRAPRPASPYGFWRTQVFEQGAWVDLIWVVGRERAWHAVIAYADEARTMPLLRWDVVRRYELGETFAEVAGARKLAFRDLTGRLEAYVDDPALFASLGLDDCALQIGQPHDLSLDNCGAPLFPFHDCDMMDFAIVERDELTFGDPRQGNRCQQRPTRVEAWTFERVPLTPDLLRALFAPL